jgi:hypothetical protein
MISRIGIAHQPGTLRKPVLRLTFLLVITGLISVSCEFEEPTSIWDLPDDQSADDAPVITDILPSDSSLAGVGEMRIVGEKFSGDMGQNVIFFNDTQAEVISDTETEIVIKTPTVTGDALAVRVARKGAYLFSNPMSYRIIPSVVKHAELGPTETPSSLAVDRNEYAYVTLATGFVRKIDPTGAAEDIGSSFIIAPGMKIGPDFDIYAMWNLRNRGQIWRFYLDTTVTIECDTTWADTTHTTYTDVTCDTTEDIFYTETSAFSFSEQGFDFDFDADGNLWAGTGTSLIHVTPDGSKTTADSYSGEVRTVRVIDGAVYALEGGEAGSQKILRSTISGAGSVGAQVQVLDLGAETDLAGVTVNNFTLSSAGDIYLATDDSASGLIVYYTDEGMFERFYPRMINTPLMYLAWGNGPFLYASYAPKAGSPAVLKIDVRKERAMQFSAPYYGREF